MTDQVAPEGGVSSIPTAPAPASPGVTPEVVTGNDDTPKPDMFNAGYSKGAEKFSGKLDAAATQIAELEAKLQEQANKGLNPDELRTVTEKAQEEVRAAQETLTKFKDSTSDYFKTRVDALSDDLKVIMETQDPGNFEAYTKMLDHCEKLQTKGATPPPSQGGAVAQDQPQSKAVEEYRAATKAGDNKKLREMMGNPTTSNEIREALRAQQKRE